MKKIDRFRDDYYFLSNMYPATVEFEGKEYLNAEAAFQAAKCLDQTQREKFTQLSGYQAKKLGRKVELRPDWEEAKLEIMYQCVWSKFRKNKALKEKLRATGDAELVEGNTWNDTFWGVCDGVGKNHLGKILMDVRTRIDLPDNAGFKHLWR